MHRRLEDILQYRCVKVNRILASIVTVVSPWTRSENCIETNCPNPALVYHQNWWLLFEVSIFLKVATESVALDDLIFVSSIGTLHGGIIELIERASGMYVRALATQLLSQ